MKVIMILIVILLSGCTTYKIHRMPDGEINITVRSSRSFEAPDLRYKRVGNDADFTFGAASVQDGTAQMVGMFGNIFEAIMSGRLIPVPQQEEDNGN